MGTVTPLTEAIKCKYLLFNLEIGDKIKQSKQQNETKKENFQESL